jgi:hypothetical protein
MLRLSLLPFLLDQVPLSHCEEASSAVHSLEIEAHAYAVLFEVLNHSLLAVAYHIAGRRSTCSVASREERKSTSWRPTWSEHAQPLLSQQPPLFISTTAVGCRIAWWIPRVIAARHVWRADWHRLLPCLESCDIEGSGKRCLQRYQNRTLITGATCASVHIRRRIAGGLTFGLTRLSSSAVLLLCSPLTVTVFSALSAIRAAKRACICSLVSSRLLVN